MKQRSEPFVLSMALSLLLGFVLFYGCSTMDPEKSEGGNPPPETHILGAEPVIVGIDVYRHISWAGEDEDGEVVRFVYAITDSLLDMPEDPDDADLDGLFDPADDPSTLEPNKWREVGYTTEQDSTFLLQVGLESGVSFHIVAQDDDGNMDPSPARLHFFSNALGKPVLKFSVSTYEDVGGGSMDWVTRWVGTPDGPSMGESPELTSIPICGFGRRFRVQWEASSPNGPIFGYRYRAAQGDGPFTPPVDDEGDKQWDPELREFEYANSVPPADLPDCSIDSHGELVENPDCPAEEVRWPSGEYVLWVEAIDIAQEESAEEAGALAFQINYAPETELVDDGSWPLYRVSDGHGGFEEFPISPPDTVPLGSYAVFNTTGYDRTEDLVAPASYGELCCDTVLNTADVQFQAAYEATFDRERFQTSLTMGPSDPFSADPMMPGDIDSIGVNVGPIEYRFTVNAIDEHGRRDESKESYEFIGGLQPRITSTTPATGDMLVFTSPALQPWPGSLPYVSSSESRYWTGEEWVEDPSDCPPNTCQVQEFGTLFQFLAQFDGSGHPDEPNTTIRAWQFNYFPDNDPLNIIADGRESKDFSNWVDKPDPGNEWVWEPERGEAIELFVPAQMFSVAALAIYEPSSSLPYYRSQGRWVANRLGEAQMAVRARTTSAGDTWPLYHRVRPDPDGIVIDFNIEESGRRTNTVEIQWGLWLGVDTNDDDVPDRLWPDFDFSDYEP